MKRIAVLWVVSCCLAVSAVAHLLPGNVIPEHYDLTLSPDLQKATFAGEEAIKVRVVSSVDTITLHALEIEFLEVTVRQGKASHKATVTLDAAGQTATFQLPSKLEPGSASVHIRYNGILNDQLRGFYLSRGKGRNYAGSQMEATDARRAFPSFDEPALKATFAITMIVDQGDTAISNGRMVADTPGPGAGKHTLKFSTTPKMSSYLVALAVGDFQCLEGAADGIPIRICSTPDKVHLGKFALHAAEQQLAWFNRYFGIPYPFGKLDVLALPDFEAGAMENAGAVFYRERLLLLDEASASLNLKTTVAFILSHEIAHMWFGDLVTMKWWDDIWLNEGFADWIANKPLMEWKPEWERRMSELAGTTDALNLDSLASTRQIRKQASTPSEITELFDGIAYGKAASVLRMVEGYVGADAFRRGVQAYLKKYSWSNASAEDFWSTLTQVSGKPVDRVMASYVDQAGAPMVAVKAACS
ncbi:MAG: M1 family metallopeptidase, partial [Acidobacteria bacterium]|nr:M1 family metallopeptidase [Acidobacteriota bacterium]